MAADALTALQGRDLKKRGYLTLQDFLRALYDVHSGKRESELDAVRRRVFRLPQPLSFHPSTPSPTPENDPLRRWLEGSKEKGNNTAAAAANSSGATTQLALGNAGGGSAGESSASGGFSFSL